LATGADPSEHGMISNVWFDRETGKLNYNIEDPRYHILSKGADIDEDTEIDTSQKLASTDGRSPANIMVTTFSDELNLKQNGKAKIFGVSVKDRGAVALAGHTGKAFWFSKKMASLLQVRIITMRIQNGQRSGIVKNILQKCLEVSLGTC